MGRFDPTIPDEGLVVEPGTETRLAKPPGYGEDAQTSADFMRGAGNLFNAYDYARSFYEQQRHGTPYNEALDAQLKLSAQAQDRSPLAYPAGTMTTGAALGAAAGAARLSTVPFLYSRAGLPGAVPASVLEGAGLGGLQAVSDPSGESSVPKAMVMGGLLGIGGPAMGRGAETAYRGTASTFGIPRSLVEAAKTDAPGVAKLAAGELGPRAMFTEAGPAFRAEAQGAVLPPVGPGAALLAANLRTRNETASPYVNRVINTQWGPTPTAPSITIKDVIDPEIKRLNGLYGQMYANPDVRAVDTQPLANWLDAKIPQLTGEPRSVLQQIRADLDVHGVPGTLDPLPQKLGNAHSHVKAKLRDQTLGNDTLGLLRQIEPQMKAELEAKVPGIRDLNSALSEMYARKAALSPRETGAEFLDTGRTVALTPEEFSRELTDASIPHGSMTYTRVPDYMRQASRHEVARLTGTAPDDLTKMRRVLGEPGDYNAQKAAIQFGQEPTQNVQDMLNREWAQRENFNKILENSQTAQRTAALKGQQYDPIRPSDIATSPLAPAAWLVNKIGAAVAQRQRNRIATFLAENDPVSVQQQAARLQNAVPVRENRAAIVNAMMQGGFRGGVSGFVPKDYGE